MLTMHVAIELFYYLVRSSLIVVFNYSMFCDTGV